MKYFMKIVVHTFTSGSVVRARGVSFHEVLTNICMAYYPYDERTAFMKIGNQPFQ